MRFLIIFLVFLGRSAACPAEFLEDFDGPGMIHDPAARAGWAWMSGDGDATMTFSQAGGIGRIEVDARDDRRNIWWAFIRRSVSAAIDENLLSQANRELRVEAKIRVSAAPRRFNLHFNHSRTTDFHSHLMEFDIPDTENWHVISMTTRSFDAQPGDEVFVQMALMDWGLDQYEIEIDYIEVKLVDPATAEADLGTPLPYRPPVMPLSAYSHRIPASQDAVVDSAWPQVNYDGWSEQGSEDGRPLIAVGGTKTSLLRWNLGDFADRRPKGWGALEITTDRIYRAETGLEEFGELRIVEILDGAPDWTRGAVTWDSFFAGEDSLNVLNGQMVMDIAPTVIHGEQTFIAISPPVLQRLMTGRTKGLAIYEQGAINATFFSGKSSDESRGPHLLFNLE